MNDDFVRTNPTPTFMNDVHGQPLMQVNTSLILGVDLSEPLYVRYDATLIVKPDGSRVYLLMFRRSKIEALEKQLSKLLNWVQMPPVLVSDKARALFDQGKHLVHLNIQNCYNSCRISRVIEAQDSTLLKAYLTNLYSNIEDWDYGLIEGSGVSEMAFDNYLKKIIGEYLSPDDVTYKENILLVDSDKSESIMDALIEEGFQVEKVYDSKTHHRMHVFLEKPIDRSHDRRYIDEYVRDATKALRWCKMPFKFIELALHFDLFRKGYDYPIDPDEAPPLHLLRAWVRACRVSVWLSPFYKERN